MSVPTWLNDAQSFPNGDNGAFNPAGDPSIAFMQTPTSSSFDPSQLQYQQMQHRMQNGTSRNASPSSQSPMYPTQNVIPSKRPRPREDSVGASPQQYPGGLPAARSQTPLEAYTGYQGAVNGGSQYPGSVGYQQFQQANNNANQSPMIQNQTFNPQASNQVAHTMSPSPFSPAAQNFGAQTSPPQSEHGSRVNTPQGGGQPYSQGLPYGASQSGAPPSNATVNGMANPQFNPPQTMNSQQQQQRIYEAAKIRQLQQAQAQAQAQANGMGIPPRPAAPLMNPLSQPVNAMQNYQMAQMRQQAQAQAQQRPASMEQMMRSMVQLMQARSLPFNPHPVIASKVMNAVQIFLCGMKMGGSRTISGHNQWPQIAQMLSIPPIQAMAAGQELQAYWNGNLIAWELQFSQQQQQQQEERQQFTAENGRAMSNPQNVDPAMRQGSFSPNKQMQDLHGQRFMQPPTQVQNQPQTPTRQGPTPQHDPRHALQNGYRMQQQVQMQGRQPNPYGVHVPGGQQDLSQPLTQQPLTIAIAKSKDSSSKGDLERGLLLLSPRKLESLYIPKAHALEPSMNGRSSHEDELDEDLRVTDTDGNAEETKKAEGQTEPIYHGGLPISDPWFKDTLDVLVKYKHTMPQLNELGVIDIRALILSIKCGIHGEVRLALDVIAALSHGSPPPLRECEDLLDTLIDCANDQIEILAEGSRKTSDTLQIPSYQEQVRGCNAQNFTLQDVPDVGSLRYDLNRAADRLICITTILRNLSFLQDSSKSLEEPSVFRMMTTVMRYLGTRKLFLLTHQNALDFSKDVIIFLSSLSPGINLTSKDEALSILAFLLSFAPEPRPNIQNNIISFAPYAPRMHRYFPHAIDSLGKLIAREPNRSLYRGIFASDNASSHSFDLLTRAFGLAVAAIPEVSYQKDPGSIIAVRSPTIVQGLLCAEILISIIPTSEHNLAYSWLRSQDGFTSKLMTMLSIIAKIPMPEPQRHRDGRLRTEDDVYLGLRMINARGLAVLRRLAERAQDAEAFLKGSPIGVFPQKQSVVQALGSNRESEVVRNLCALAGLES